MGLVHKAEDEKLKRTVAIKFLPPHFTRNEEARIRFSQEAQAASALDHANICTIHEIDQTKDEQIFLVMAYYEGETLDKKIQRGPLSVTESLKIAIQVAEGLSQAHKHGIVHRDIKPANIIISADGVVKILDFGLAKLAGQPHMTKEHTSIGTVNYMSPEQAQGDVVDDRTDIWSLGILLYETISGQFPFRGEYEQAVIYNIINQDPTPIHDMRTGVPRKIDHIIKKSLAKKPSERYQTVLEMLDDLKRTLDELETGTAIKIPAVMHSLNHHRIRIFAAAAMIIILGIIAFKFLLPVTENDRQTSITILPFENLNQSIENEYFSDGITEDIAVQLSKIADLRVIAFGSSKFYKNSAKDLKLIGEELNVENILTGTVRREDNLIRITTQLIKADAGVQLWAETYDRNLSEIFDIQSEVAQKIAAALEVTLSDDEVDQIDKKYTKNLNAYDYYLQGRNYYNRLRLTDNETAINLFKKAYETDPDFSAAYAGLADAFVQKTLRFGEDSFWLDSAIVQCDRALQIDPQLAEAHKTLGLIYYAHSWFDKSLEENEEALALNPNFYIAMHNQGWINLNLGNFVQADRWFEKARRVNPTFASTYLGMGLLYLNIAEFDRAKQWLNYAYEIHPDLKPNPVVAMIMIEILSGDMEAAQSKGEEILSQITDDEWIYMAAADVALQSGDPTTAGEYYQKTITINPKTWHPFTGVNATTSFGFILWKTDHKKEAEEMFAYSLDLDDKTLEQGSQWWGVSYDLAAINAIRDNKSECISLLDTAVKQGFRLFSWLSIDPLFENMREDERFQKILSDLNTQVALMKTDISN